jgi:hypothetical protein
MSCCGSLFVNLGGGGGTGMLQIAGGVPLDSTLRFVEDQNGTDSRLQLSTTEVGFEQSSAGYINRWYNSGGTANARKYAVYVDANYWSLTTRNDAENSGEQFLIATALASNLSTLQLGKSGSPLILSTQLATLASSNLVIGTTSASARLHVRGDGTNPIARFENSAGVGRISIADVGTLTTTVALGQANFTFGYVGNATFLNMNSNGVITHYSTSSGSGIETFRVIADGIASHTSGAMRILQVSGAGFSPPSGTGIYRPFEINYTLNASGANTGTATGIFLNATETALNGMAHNLMNLQVGGSSKFLIDNLGSVTAQKYTSDNLSTGTLTTARPMQFGDKGTVTTGNDLGLDAQIAVEHNGQVYYIPCSTVLLT